MEVNVYEARKECLSKLSMRCNSLTQKLSKMDLKEQDMLHFLEDGKYDAVVMVKLAKQMRELRKARRVVKVEIEQIQSLMATMNAKKLEAFAHKDYTYRTDVLADLVGIKHGHKTKH